VRTRDGYRRFMRVACAIPVSRLDDSHESAATDTPDDWREVRA
jgi:hypothetical protein